ncbi:MAG: hypothetical protein Q9222_000135 [Ikaeria aurantiellina]
MPAKKGGGPRKGQLGKKSQIEQLIKSSNKSQGAFSNIRSTSVKNDDCTKFTSIKVPQTLNPKPSECKPKPKPSSVGVIKQPERCVSSKVVIVRLPYQHSMAPAKKQSVMYTQPPLPTSVPPAAYKNPNRVIVRLPPSPQATSFLSLPAEVRSTIYQYLFSSRTYRVEWIPRTDQRPTELTYSLPKWGKPGPRLTAEVGLRRRMYDMPKRQYYDRVIPRYSADIPSPAALLLVSKKVNNETTPMFYGRNTFSFTAIRPLRKFLNTLRPETRTMIRSLELIHHTAGNPMWIDNQMWKDKYDRSWHDLLFQIRNQCIRLNFLSLDLTINDLPFKLGAHASWMDPLYAFMGLANLKHINVRLRQPTTDEAVLQVEAYEVRRMLMGDNFYEPTSTRVNEKLPSKQPRGKACPGVNALRIVGNMKIPVSRMANPQADNRATIFWSPPTPPGDDDKLVFAKKPKAQRSIKGKGKAKEKC